MPIRSLPDHPDLDQLKRQARELQREHRAGSKGAAARVLAHRKTPRELTLADAQLVIAREYGFRRWADLKHRVEVAARVARLQPHPRFDEALRAFDAGDLTGLRALIAADPSLVRARGNLQPPPGYFTAATLLHHVAGNPFRVPLPANVVEIARFLIEAGAEVDAETFSPRGAATTMGLIITSGHCSAAGFSGPLMDLLLAHGAHLDLEASDVVYTALANHAVKAAEKMIELGARADLCTAAALGRMDLVRDAFDAEGRLRVAPRPQGRPLSQRDAIGLAALLAYVLRRPEVVDFLLERDGNWDMIGVNNGTIFHRATSGGDLPMVQRLVARGADHTDRNNPFHATPFSWAEHEKRMEVFDWMRAHCPIDLHDAVSFGLLEHVIARLDEDPARVNRTLDQWDIPASTPLHHAAYMDREEIARVLLDRGAAVDPVAGDGRTALDIAEARGATAVAALLRARGGRRASEL